MRFSSLPLSIFKTIVVIVPGGAYMGAWSLNKNHLMRPHEKITHISSIQQRNFAAANMRPDLGHD